MSQILATAGQYCGVFRHEYIVYVAMMLVHTQCMHPTLQSRYPVRKVGCSNHMRIHRGTWQKGRRARKLQVQAARLMEQVQGVCWCRRWSKGGDDGYSMVKAFLVEKQACQAHASKQQRRIKIESGSRQRFSLFSDSLSSLSLLYTIDMLISLCLCVSLVPPMPPAGHHLSARK